MHVKVMFFEALNSKLSTTDVRLYIPWTHLLYILNSDWTSSPSAYKFLSRQFNDKDERTFFKQKKYPKSFCQV